MLSSLMVSFEQLILVIIVAISHWSPQDSDSCSRVYADPSIPTEMHPEWLEAQSLRHQLRAEAVSGSARIGIGTFRTLEEIPSWSHHHSRGQVDAQPSVHLIDFVRLSGFIFFNHQNSNSLKR
jgi:hypothetical protein